MKTLSDGRTDKETPIEGYNSKIITNYCLGFAFDKPGHHVVLIKKNKPEWQAGKLNGVGGKVEPHELVNSAIAMAREFKEETGLQTEPDEWTYYGHLFGKHFVVDTFLRYNDDIVNAKTTTEEEVVILGTETYHHFEHISNLPWLINAALDEQFKRKEVQFRAQYFV